MADALSFTALTRIAALGYAMAFATAMAVIMVDCRTALQKKLKFLPVNVLRYHQPWLLAGACGLVSALCFHFSKAPLVTQNVELKWQNPLGRGLLIGLAVLTILRSKFLNFKDTEIGGEFFYNLARGWALGGVWNTWNASKNKLTPDTSLVDACRKSTFEAELVRAVREALKVRDDSLMDLFDGQLRDMQSIKPAPGTPCDDSGSIFYCRTLVKLALDMVGAKAIASVYPPAPQPKPTTSVRV